MIKLLFFFVWVCSPDGEERPADRFEEYGPFATYAECTTKAHDGIVVSESLCFAREGVN